MHHVFVRLYSSSMVRNFFSELVRCTSWFACKTSFTVMIPAWLSVQQQLPSNFSYKPHLVRKFNCYSLRCSWSIACRRCSNYIFVLELMPGSNWFRKDNCKARRETFKFWDLVCLISEIWRYVISTLYVTTYVSNKIEFVISAHCLAFLCLWICMDDFSIVVDSELEFILIFGR